MSKSSTETLSLLDHEQPAPGPADYTPNSSSVSTVAFTMSQRHADLSLKKVTPSPEDYSPQHSLTAIETAMPKFSMIPRRKGTIFEEIQKRSLSSGPADYTISTKDKIFGGSMGQKYQFKNKNVVPGPGDYTPIAEKVAKKAPAYSISVVQGKSFIDEYNRSTPGIGEYSKLPSMSKRGVGAFSRYSEKPQKPESPGVGQYTVNDAAIKKRCPSFSMRSRSSYGFTF